MRRSLILAAVLAGIYAAAAPAGPQATAQHRPADARAVADRIAVIDRRQERMKQVSRSSKTLAAYVKGDVKDPAQARMAAALIRGVAQDMVTLWPRGTAVGVSDSKTKPEAWTDARGSGAVATFRTAADGLSAAAAGGDRAAVAQQLDTLGRTCRSCHGAFVAKR